MMKKINLSLWVIDKYKEVFMNQEQVIKKLLLLDNSVEDFVVNFFGKNKFKGGRLV